MELVGATSIGLGLGYLAWKKAGFPWWVLLVTSVLGLAAAMVRVKLMADRLNRVAEDERAHDATKRDGNAAGNN